MPRADIDDPFAILGLPPSFRVTSAEVAAAHLRVCAKLHPDRARDLLERDDFMRRSAAAGQAKQQLMSEVGRAEAVLALAGVPAVEAPLPVQFLAETMDLRERIEVAMDDEGARKEVRAEVERSRAACVVELATACDKIGSATEQPDMWGKSARSALARLRYLDRMISRLSDAS